VAEERLKPLLDRLERERLAADRLYNEALTAVDRASVLADATLPPAAPPPYDDSQLERANRSWDILPGGPPAVDGSLKGRLRGVVWRMIGPSIETQKAFNAAVVDHLNRNVEAHRASQQVLAETLDALRRHVAGVVAFQHAVILYLQTITGYVDTKGRESAAAVNAGLSAVSDDWMKRWESLAAREARFHARVESLDDLKATATLAQQTAAALKREVATLLAPSGSTASRDAHAGTSDRNAATPSSPSTGTVDLDAINYLGFEAAFRGSEEAIRSRLAGYVPKFAGRSDVLDIGCGRGEFLDLLRAAGISARGLDLNREMVETSRRRGHDVAEGDALGYIASLPDASLGGLFAAQVVEHLEPVYLGRLLETARLKLRPGSVMVLETINPSCWLAFFESYIRDLTHVRPLHPETLQFLARATGFHDVTIEMKTPVADAERLQSAPGLRADDHVGIADAIDTFNENFAKLNARLFSYLDYAVAART
jgi:SAM-dependent methyltransferase